MAKQTAAQRPKRSPVSWFRAHKVWGALLVLLVGGALYWGISEIVWQYQVHAERSSYYAADALMHTLAQQFKVFHPETDAPFHQCSYSDNGAVFAMKFLGCQTDLDINFTPTTPDEAVSLDQKVRAMISNNSIKLQHNASAQEKSDVNVSVFSYKGLACGYSATYYDPTMTKGDRYSEALTQGSDLYINIGCSGAAKAPYFPLTSP